MKDSICRSKKPLFFAFVVLTLGTGMYGCRGGGGSDDKSNATQPSSTNQSSCDSDHLGAPYPHGILAVGGRQACALTLEGVRCWGTSFDGFDAVDPQTKVPTFLSTPRQVSASIFNVCVLDNCDVWCWKNSNTEPAERVPDLTNPRQISVGESASCALDDLGVQCWGNASWEDLSFGPFNVPDGLDDASQVSVGRRHVCAVADSRLHCWGNNDYGQLDVPDNLSNPREVRTSEFSTCVLDDSGVRCWGGVNTFAAAINHPPTDLRDPRQISLSTEHACVLDESSVRCWGPDWLSFSPFMHLMNPREVAGGGNGGQSNTCTLDDSGVWCYGGNQWGVNNIPNDLMIDW